MVTFTTKILRFAQNKEKTGWSYILIDNRKAEKIKPGCKKSLRVKGLLDNHKIQKAALMPMGDGNFILPINSALRKATGKSAGDTLKAQLELDQRQITLSADFIACLKDDARAYEFFKTLPRGHQMYFSKWIESAKTISTKTKRITMAVIGLAAHQGFGEMIRANKKMDGF
jgi:hypothetical protein